MKPNSAENPFPAKLAELAKKPVNFSAAAVLRRRGEEVTGGGKSNGEVIGGSYALTFEAMQTIASGRSVMARLIPAENRLEIETAGHVNAIEVASALPELVQLLADKSGLSVRHGGRVYTPGRVPTPAIWGGPNK